MRVRVSGTASTSLFTLDFYGTTRVRVRVRVRVRMRVRMRLRMRVRMRVRVSE